MGKLPPFIQQHGIGGILQHTKRSKASADFLLDPPAVIKVEICPSLDQNCHPGCDEIILSYTVWQFFIRIALPKEQKTALILLGLRVIVQHLK